MERSVGKKEAEKGGGEALDAKVTIGEKENSKRDPKSN